MDVQLRPAADPAVLEAVRRAAREAELLDGASRTADTSAWLRAARLEGVERTPPLLVPRRAGEDDQARSPRSTRGATRA